MKSKMEVSTDISMLLFEHWKLSSIELSSLIIRLANYNVTLSLIYKSNIGDTQGFSVYSLNRYFSNETLKGVR